MTVIIGYKDGENVWACSDTRITVGQETRIDSAIDSKLLRMKYGILGAAGDLAIRNLMELYISQNDEVEFHSKLEVISFFLGFKRFLRRYCGLGPSQQDELPNLNSNWLLFTKDKLFEVSSDGAVLEYSDLCAVGSGSPAALAVFSYIATYQPKLEFKTAIRRAYEVSVAQNLSCGGPMVLTNVTELLSCKNS